jgi:putative ATP-dependent endonuclease of the OLD family
MRLCRVNIKNFRAVEDATLEVGQHTVIIGGNGVGKSCALKAIDKFFSKTPTVTAEDFHNKNVTDPIEITLTFTEFSAEEAEIFSSRIHGNEMAVTRVLSIGVASKDNGRYFGRTPRHLPFEEVRSVQGAVQRKQAYNVLRGQDPYTTLDAATNEAQVFAGLEAWEANHPAQCELSRDDGQFFGFTNVGRGVLQKYISFVFVPAVRDAAADAVDKGSSVVSQLVELLVKTVVQKREEFQKWQEKTTREYQELVRPENIGELGDLSGLLTGTLQNFYGDTEVGLAWRPPEEFRIALPAADVSLTEQGYSGPVEGKGHGLQRAFIFTILQHLAHAIRSQSDNPEAIEEGEGQNHSLILAIEEPELYQHPTKQRHISRVLAEISAGKIAGVMNQTQIVICSHSPHFVSTERFNEIRLARRQMEAGTGQGTFALSRVSYDEVCGLLNQTLGLEGNDAYTVDSLVAKLHILDPLVAEGFFASVVVLVEGVGDRAALTAVARARGIDFEAKGIALIPVGGKINIARPHAVFSLFGIPVYALFDSDANLNPDDRHPEVNIGIQRLSLLPDPVEFRTFVGNRVASFETCLELVLAAELGDEFSAQVVAAQKKYGMPKKRILKSPVSLGEVVSGCLNKGIQSQTLNSIVDRIAALA